MKSPATDILLPLLREGVACRQLTRIGAALALWKVAVRGRRLATDNVR
jgi:hypothetical protein